jgi:hypothetical protein
MGVGKLLLINDKYVRFCRLNVAVSSLIRVLLISNLVNLRRLCAQLGVRQFGEIVSFQLKIR